ncbi:MAG: hypothetical protein RMM53_01940 [Bacteroidia bacterium]|nr:hypothetical protein [Bacteroidia bacterium]MDW8332955.1 hypothetical protein [Bacteroidia bacterium]
MKAIKSAAKVLPVFVSLRVWAQPLRIESRNFETRTFTVFRPHQETILALTLKRPDPSDPELWLCVAAAPTDPRGGVQGVVVVEGKIIQTDVMQWDGAALILNHRLQILDANKGYLFTDDFIKTRAKAGATLFQAPLLVYQYKPRKVLAGAEIQRRALVMLHDDSPAVVESRHPTTLDRFAADLAQIGVKHAVELDMAGRSEGWYRDPEHQNPVPIGENKTRTATQTNWLIFRKKT